MRIKTFLLLLLCITNVYAYRPERLFYLTPNIADTTFSTDQLEQIKNHAKSIDILAPQIYQLNENGVIWGSIDPKLLALAQENKLKVMPLIVNANFDQEQFHNLLNNKTAQDRAITAMLDLCKQYRFYGFQFDFENIHIKDKQAFTDFFRLAANRFHQNGLTISVAVVPRISDTFSNNYERWYFENWSGAYDYQALGKMGDFISLMSYDRHTSLTTPGPIAAYNWVEKTLQYILKVVPANKVSLGIPNYSGYWASGQLGSGTLLEKYTYRSKETTLSYSRMLSLLSETNQPLVWNDVWKSFYVLFNKDDKTEYLFIEDEKSFQAKIPLTKRYQLRGLSVWKLGLEDPAIWNNPLLQP